ncbi:flagellar hook capping FlgD N-terminal domain-containing protein [Paenibacillus sp. GCM10012307]|uniref:Flagellar hook capping protein n=1 Tax=Paenibacillus roseus TaxID=2798579 RepID=A0A934JAD1_9BACL|nr:flagellar hook capping FlgD N-terminal domain-containing protein [Paenibacillus roseus]MBJ6363382.1 flagellar hook capping protein [Paenibacillus roseus]
MSEVLPTKNVWPNYNVANVRSAPSKEKADTLGQDEFLRILIAQIRHQDPMNPLQDRDFIAQMAQFSSVEQLMKMSGELKLMRNSLGTASSMIGKTIEWIENDSQGASKLQTGVVDSITIKDGKLFAISGDSKVNLDDIVAIRTAPEGDIPEENEAEEEVPQPDEESDDVTSP